MKTMIVSYSMTGNNDSLARSLAERLSAEHIGITEAKPRNMGTIMFDMMFGRMPEIQYPAIKAEEYDNVIFVGPVWMGHAAAPFRACFRELGPKLGKYAFVSISGGADGPNPKLSDDLAKWLGKKPVALVDLHIANLLPPEPKPTRNDTMAYKLNEKDIAYLADTAAAALPKEIAGR